MSEPAVRRFGRLTDRTPSLPTEREWEGSILLQPRRAPRLPELVSDGGGLPFSLAALAEPAGHLDPEDPAVAALIERLAPRKAPKAGSRAPWKRAAAPPPPPPAGPPPGPPSLDNWRLVARSGDEVLFARGRPPELLTVAVRRESRRSGWRCIAVSTGKPLRATREGVRASGWRLDPTHEVDPSQSVLRVLITEQTWAGGKRADGRLLAPDLHVGGGDLVLTAYVAPPKGYQVRMPNPETPARIALPEPVGRRPVIDGAVYWKPPAEEAPVDDVPADDESAG